MQCLKVKLRGNDAAWDYERLVQLGTIGLEHEVRWLIADFNCTLTDPEYVNAILDRLLHEYPRLSTWTKLFAHFATKGRPRQPHLLRSPVKKGTPRCSVPDYEPAE